ncbi:EI24 domain-containing protein [Pseudoroseicyclus aestuarii]|uniref:Uncharacterized protein involved in cysteine biosynthesis n=1 Tax=Pseudoroseicyclus aestuarii TaxID=1795041 RepID=A0A318SUT9_9RHOB|nr:EI24 domain-containing protein [Pseudoroseicyclus aestuarii]PYE85383.1 uncharacterized protein involved in cysteine biosynthesis [Pseudoroseicyclus aestuarii]
MILRDLLRVLGQLGDPRFLRVLALGVGLTLALLIGACAAALWGAGALAPETLRLPLLGEVGWLDDAAGWGAALLVLGLSVFLMIPVASAITSIFLDQVAQAVEDRWYPGLPAAHQVTLLQGLRDTLGFLGLMLALNAGVFALSLVFPPAGPFLFLGLNGWLLGREYFTLAALRREGRAQALALRRRHAGQIWLAGVLMALPLVVPVMNLLVPVLGAAAFTHLYHRVAAPRGGR